MARLIESRMGGGRQVKELEEFKKRERSPSRTHPGIDNGAAHTNASVPT
jgi:hypothetical protein